MDPFKGLYLRHNKWWLRSIPAPGAAQVRVSLETDDPAEVVTRAKEIKTKAGQEMRQQMDSCYNELDQYLAYLKRQNLAEPPRDSLRYVLNSFLAAVSATSPKQLTPSYAERSYSSSDILERILSRLSEKPLRKNRDVQD